MAMAGEMTHDLKMFCCAKLAQPLHDASGVLSAKAARQRLEAVKLRSHSFIKEADLQIVAP